MESPRRVDLLVLGGGAAGCVLAARLSADPERRVCLVEAGPDPGRLADGGWPADVLDSHQLPISHDWCYDDGLAWSARILGGCSAHNACIITWGSDEDYDEWGEGWSAEMLEPYRRRAEQAIGLRLGREQPGAWHEAVLAAATAAGFTGVDDLNAAGVAVAAGLTPLNDRGGVRWNAALAYLDEPRRRPNLAILDRTVVDRVEFAGGRATGARLLRDGRPLTVAADTVVVSAGAYGSPAILLRSGVGPERDLAALGITPVAVREGVGRNLINHWTARLLLEPGPELAAATAADHAAGGAHTAGALVKAASGRCPPGSWDTHLFSICWGIRDELGMLTGDHVFRIAVAAMKPHSRGSLRLTSTDPQTPPRIDHGALSDSGGDDLATLADGIERAREIAACDPLFRRGVRELAPDGVSDDSLASHVRSTLGCYFHPVGTCRIGAAGDPLAVVDGEGAVYGCPGLYVADASIMPTIPRANTHLTTLAVAERIAELLGRSAVRPGE